MCIGIHSINPARLKNSQPPYMSLLNIPTDIQYEYKFIAGARNSTRRPLRSFEYESRRTQGQLALAERAARSAWFRSAPSAWSRPARSTPPRSIGSSTAQRDSRYRQSPEKRAKNGGSDVEDAPLALAPQHVRAVIAYRHAERARQ